MEGKTEHRREEKDAKVFEEFGEKRTVLTVRKRVGGGGSRERKTKLGRW